MAPATHQVVRRRHGQAEDIADGNRRPPASPEIVVQEGKGSILQSAITHDKTVAVCVGVLSFLLYVATLPPTVVGGDSGEIVVAAWKLALPHPPGDLSPSADSETPQTDTPAPNFPAIAGYPLITLIGHVFMRYHPLLPASKCFPLTL